jgi:hypothetical protein
VITPLVNAERGLFGRRVPGVGAAEPAQWPDFGPNLASGLAEDVVSAIEARAIWARYGL